MKNSILMALLFGAVMVSSCKNKGDYKALNGATSDIALVAADSIAPHQAKLVKTADMSFKVKNVEQTGEDIMALTTKLNGMVTHHLVTSTVDQSSDIRLSNDSLIRVSAYNTHADMTVKIPSDKIEDFLNTVGHMGVYVFARRMDIDDRSLDYLESQLKLNSRKELVNAQKTGRLVVKDPNAVLDFKDGLVDEQINNRRIDDEVKYSTISLSFYQSNTINKEVIVNDDPTAYEAPFFSRLSVALSNGWLLFKGFIILLADVWVFIIGGFAVWFLLKWYRRKMLLPLK